MKKIMAPLAMGAVLFACSNEGIIASADGPAVQIEISALQLDSVADVVWDLSVTSRGDATPETVTTRRITSSQYGDGAGDASYISPCDAGGLGGTCPNDVEVLLIGVYGDTVSAPGSFAGAAPLDDSAAPPETIQNPGTLSRSFTCSDNQDTLVAFDVTVLRNASQGFFDIAVNFDDIFCSAKFDCCDWDAGAACTTACDTDNDCGGSQTCQGASEGAQGTCCGACQGDIELLYDASGARSTTFVLGFACAAGATQATETHLFLDDIRIDCTDGVGTTRTLVLDPDPEDATSNPPGQLAGNLCTAGQATAAGCASITGDDGPDDVLFQAAVFRGEELFSAFDKRYWNVAIGVNKDTLSALTCTLNTQGVAGDEVGDIVTPVGAVYPTIIWEDIPLSDGNGIACEAHPLGQYPDQPHTGYIYGQGASYDHHYGPLLATLVDLAAYQTFATGPNDATLNDLEGYVGQDFCAVGDVLVGGGCEPPQYVPGIVSYGAFPTAYNDGSDDHQGFRCISARTSARSATCSSGEAASRLSTCRAS